MTNCIIVTLDKQRSGKVSSFTYKLNLPFTWLLFGTNQHVRLCKSSHSLRSFCFLSRMCQHVLIKITTVCKAFVTQLALMWFDPSVNKHMGR